MVRSYTGPSHFSAVMWKLVFAVSGSAARQLKKAATRLAGLVPGIPGRKPNTRTEQQKSAHGLDHFRRFFGALGMRKLGLIAIIIVLIGITLAFAPGRRKLPEYQLAEVIRGEA